VIWILYIFFWVFPRRQIVVSRRFGTLYQFHLQRLGVPRRKYTKFSISLFALGLPSNIFFSIFVQLFSALFSSYQLSAQFLMLHYYPQHVSSSTLLIFRKTHCIITASGIVTLCKEPYSMPVESGLKLPTWCTIPIFYNNICYIIILNMFRAVPCSSSGGQIVLLQPLVSSLSVKSRTVCRLKTDSSYQLDAQFLYSITIYVTL